MISTAVGLEATDPDMVTLFRSMGASGIRTFLKLRLPGALSNVFAGLKLGMSLAVVGAIVGEFVAADRGLGYYLLYANGQFDAVGVFATMIVLTVIGVILYFMIEMVQAFLLPKGMLAVDRFNQGSL
jgi:NitT/TauT family transport system permease protein